MATVLESKEELKIPISGGREKKDDKLVTKQMKQSMLDYLIHLAKKHEETKKKNRELVRKKRESMPSKKKCPK